MLNNNHMYKYYIFKIIMMDIKKILLIYMYLISIL